MDPLRDQMKLILQFDFVWAHNYGAQFLSDIFIHNFIFVKIKKKS